KTPRPLPAGLFGTRSRTCAGRPEPWEHDGREGDVMEVERGKDYSRSILPFAALPAPKDAPMPAVWFWRRCRSAAASNHMVVLAALAMAFLCYRFGEKIAIGDGYGWDGFFYGKLAEDFSTAFKE